MASAIDRKFRQTHMNRLVIITLLFLLSGCAVYHPQTTDIPLIDHKSDMRIDIGASVIPSVHSTISYGLTNKIAIQAFGSIGFEDRYYLQLSPGIYKPLRNQRVIELYTGLGLGHANTIKNPLSNMPEAVRQSLRGNYQLYFVQLNWGKNVKESREVGWGLGLKTGIFQSNLTDENYYSVYSEAGPFIQNRENSILVEPVFLLRTGNNKTECTVKFGLTRIFNLCNPDHYIPAPLFNIGLGINFKLNRGKN